MWLGIASIALVVIAGIILAITGIRTPDDSENIGLVEGVWRSLMRTLDPGTMGGDQGWAFRILMLLVTVGGIFIISTFIGTLTSGLEASLDELRKGRSKVLEEEHTLILGWSPKVFSIIQQLIIANENQKKPRIVVMADMDKVEMEDAIRVKVADTKNTKVICRSGSPLDLYDLEKVSPHTARSIIILSSEHEESADTYVIKSVLALTNNPNRKTDPYHIVAEIIDIENLEVAEMVGNGEANFVLSSDLIARVTAQTCRQSGLSAVYTELMQFEGDELYFADAGSFAGQTFRDTLFGYETSSVIGIFSAGNQVLINPAMDTVLSVGDQVIAISEDDDTVVASGKKEFNITDSAISRSDTPPGKKERTLILGWNERGTRIIEELDNYVSVGSEVLIVCIVPDAAPVVEELKSQLKNIVLRFQRGVITDRHTLESLDCDQYDHIIILSSQNMDVQESDAKTLICLLHLRNLSERSNKDFSIVSEMLDVRNRSLAEVAKADDFIISDNLVSLMLTQISENKYLKKVYDVLFEAEGSEIYLKPASNYIQPGQTVNFYTILESAARKNEIAIGYRTLAHERDADKNYGIRLNPNKAETFSLTKDDKVIVLAEDW